MRTTDTISQMTAQIYSIIYCRVSTDEQVGNYSLGTQEAGCREYCKRKAITVDRVFVEEGESAKTTDRPIFQQALDYCRKNKGKIRYFIVYKLNRFARNQYDHAMVKALLAKHGVGLRSASEEFDESAAGKLIENTLATFAQFDNDQRAETTVEGMKAALYAGRWPFSLPLGYMAGLDANGEPLPRIDTDRAHLIKRVFEQYVTGNFTKRQVLRNAIAAGLTTKKGKPVSQQTFDKLLQIKFYAGFVYSRKWKIERRGLHEPLITEELFNSVQAVLTGKKLSVTPHLRNHPDFPLRRFVRCARCSRPLTGSWCKGRNESFPFYRCPNTRCVSIRKENLEGYFLALLGRLTPQTDILRLFKAIVVDVWKQKQGDAEAFLATLEEKLADLKERKTRLLDMFLDKRIRQEDYEERNDALRQEIGTLEMEAHATKLEELDLEECLGFADTVLSQPSRLWFDADCDQKQRLQKVFFPEGLTFDGESFGTAVTGSMFSCLEAVVQEKTTLASPTGFEPVLPP